MKSDEGVLASHHLREHWQRMSKVKKNFDGTARFNIKITEWKNFSFCINWMRNLIKKKIYGTGYSVSDLNFFLVSFCSSLLRFQFIHFYLQCLGHLLSYFVWFHFHYQIIILILSLLLRIRRNLDKKTNRTKKKRLNEILSFINLREQE